MNAKTEAPKTSAFMKQAARALHRARAERDERIKAMEDHAETEAKTFVDMVLPDHQKRIRAMILSRVEQGNASQFIYETGYSDMVPLLHRKMLCSALARWVISEGMEASWVSRPDDEDWFSVGVHPELHKVKP